MRKQIFLILGLGLIMGGLIMGLIFLCGKSEGRDLPKAAVNARVVGNQELPSTIYEPESDTWVFNKKYGQLEWHSADGSQMKAIDMRSLLLRTLEYIDPDKELQRAVSLIDGCQEDPKKVIERYIKIKQLREDIEKILEVLNLTL